MLGRGRPANFMKNITQNDPFHNATFTVEQITYIGGIIQAKIDERYSRLKNHAETLPFTNTRVVQLSDFGHVFMQDFVYEIRLELNKV